MRKIIVVEDEYLLRLGLIRSMPWEEYGCEVVGEAANAEDGVRLASALRPDIVITDIHLPDMDGLRMIGAIKENVDCEFIILSGYGQFEYAKRAVALGVRGYLLKPVDDDEFLAVLEETAQMVDRKRQYNRLLERYVERCADRDGIDAAYLAMEPASNTDKYLSAAIEYIREHCAEDITSKSVADSLHISVSYLGKLFKANTGYTFLEYVTLMRVRRSMQLLEETDHKTYQIAAMVGYQDTRYFSDTFKKIVGMTPTQYRNH